MRRLAALLAGCLTGVPFLFAPASLAGADQITRIIAFPSEAHVGDTVHLSGCCFPPHAKEYISEFCPNFNGLAYGSGQFMLGPKTDASGQFLDYHWKQIPLRKGVDQSACTFYASVRDNPIGLDQAASIQVVPIGRRIPYRKGHITVSISASPRKVRPGHQESIALTSWPDAIATVWVGYPHRPGQKMTQRLDWEGLGTVTWRARHVSKPTAAQIRVHVRLGNEAGGGGTHFIVLH